MQFSTITSWARLIWEGLGTYGLDADSVFRDVGLDPEALKDSGARYSVPAMGRLWRAATERSGDPCFGLVAAAQWHPTTWHGLGYAWLASATIEEGFRRLVRYSAVLSTAADFRLEKTGGDCRLSISAVQNSPVQPQAVVMDAIAANVVHMCRVIYGPDFKPRRVELAHPGTGCRQKRREFFHSPVEYGSEISAVWVDGEIAQKPLSTANADLAHANEKVIADYLANLDNVTVGSRVKARLIDDLPSGDVTERVVAESLFLSLRSLQRKLHAEDTTYKNILDVTRRELAEGFIKDQTLTLNEITYLLGFSEISSFSRFFKRWTGQSPSAYRQTIERQG